MVHTLLKHLGLEVSNVELVEIRFVDLLKSGSSRRVAFGGFLPVSRLMDETTLCPENGKDIFEWPGVYIHELQNTRTYMSPRFEERKERNLRFEDHQV